MGGNVVIDISRKRKKTGDDLDERNVIRPPQPPFVQLNCTSFKEDACQVIVDGRETVPKFLARGYTRPRTKIVLLPYHERLNKWLDEQLLHLEIGINTAIVVDEPLPSLHNYLVYMIDFIDRFGQRFVKEQHVRLIRLAYQMLVREGQWHEVVHLAAQLLEKIIAGSRLTRKDIVLDWNPVFKLYYDVKYGKREEVAVDKISKAVYKLKRFYSIEATPEIWEKLQVYISPRNTNKTFCDLCARFLAVDMTAEEHRKWGAGLWWDTLWPMYTMVEMGRFWGETLVSLFASVFFYAPDFMDPTDLFEDVFTRILRGMGLSMRMGKIMVGDGSGMANIDGFARLVGDWLGGPRSCQSHLDRLMKCLDPFLHPSNTGDHTEFVLTFMYTLSERVLDRVFRERIKKHKRLVPKEYYLSDDDISKFVTCMMSPALTAIYCDSEQKLGTKVVMVLASLDPGAVIPKFLDHAYSALNAVCEPHRLTQTLECLVEVIFQLAADHKADRKKTPMRKDWIGELDQVLTAVSSHRIMSTSDKERIRLNAAKYSLRHHLIYLLEALTVAIDINDSWKTTITLQNIILIFHLVPIVDSSGCIPIWKDLTEDEIELCKLTARLPELANEILDKILHVIQSLSICAPKDSIDLLGGLKDGFTETGDDEKTLKAVIDRTISILLAHSSAPVAKTLVDKIFWFISTNQFESTVATDMTTGVLAQAVYARPESWSMFAEYVLKKLKVVLTPEARRLKDLDCVALWYVNLASGLFCTTSEAYVKNKNTCFEIIGLLIDCDAKKAHETGGIGLWFSLYMLSRTYTMNQHVISEHLSQPLNKWVPIREWAKSYQEHEVALAWHVPDESRRKVIHEMLDRFAFPLFEKLNDEKLDTFSLRKNLNLLNMAFSGAVTCLPMPDSAYAAPINPGGTVLPPAKRGPTGVPNVLFDIPYPGGGNVREKLVSVLEQTINRLASKQDDSKALATIASLLRIIVDSKSVDTGELESLTAQSSQVYAFLNNPVQFGKRFTMSAIEAFMYSNHLNHVCREQSLPYSDFHHRVMKLLVRLGLNDYPEVRGAAQVEFTALLAEHPQAREPMIELVVPVLLDPKSSEENLKGALAMIHDNKWASSCNMASRLNLWTAIVTMPMMDRPVFTEYLDAIWGQIGTISSPIRVEKPDLVLEKMSREWLAKQPRAGKWANYDTDEKLEAAKKLRLQRRAEKKAEEAALVDKMLALINTGDLHHTRSKICRTMLWRCQRQRANAGTIKVLVTRLADEEEYLRDRCADELSFWLKKNKPKTIRVDWKCPQKPADTPHLQCGLRPDNLCMAYDSENLPTTEEKWNNMVFFSKQLGCYRWPKSISVVAPASSPRLLDRGPLSPAELVIVKWFGFKMNLSRWVDLLLIEKREDAEFNENTSWIIKYMLRNFPENKDIFDNITDILKKLMSSKDRAGQRLAAEFFMGVAKGTKYYPFKVLDSMWKWLAPAVDKMYNQLVNEAELPWTNVVHKVLSKDDPRRFFWLIEQLLKGMTRPAPTAWHQAVRADIITASKWRDIETRKRICEIAWNQLPTATIEIQRYGVSTALKHICTVYDTNMNNDLSAMPDRFKLRGTDFWLNRFENKISTATLLSPPTTSRSSAHLSRVDAKEGAGTDSKARTRHPSKDRPQSLEERQRLSHIYLRTLLEFLLQYYEDCMTCLTPGIVGLFNTLLDYSNEEESEDQATFKDVDIKQSASMLVHDYMSSLLLVEKFADSFLGVILEAYNRTILWRVKVSVLKYLQVIVFSNIYVCERNGRPKKVLDLIMRALSDVQNEVRQEASRCLLPLVHCNYIKMDDELVSQLTALSSNETHHRYQHGAVLGYGAVVMAHPYSTPTSLLPILSALCKVSSKHADMQVAATSALREFRRSHRDHWAETVALLGPNLVYQIENAIAPVYYA